MKNAQRKPIYVNKFCNMRMLYMVINICEVNCDRMYQWVSNHNMRKVWNKSTQAKVLWMSFHVQPWEGDSYVQSYVSVNDTAQRLWKDGGRVSVTRQTREDRERSAVWETDAAWQPVAWWERGLRKTHIDSLESRLKMRLDRRSHKKLLWACNTCKKLLWSHRTGLLSSKTQDSWHWSWCEFAAASQNSKKGTQWPIRTEFGNRKQIWWQRKHLALTSTVIQWHEGHSEVS